MVKPNQGSDEAIYAGCTCPVLDNMHGQGGGPWWISEDCPIHATGNSKAEGGEG
jgi:hypothetical protein